MSTPSASEVGTCDHGRPWAESGSSWLPRRCQGTERTASGLNASFLYKGSVAPRAVSVRKDQVRPHRSGELAERTRVKSGTGPTWGTRVRGQYLGCGQFVGELLHLLLLLNEQLLDGG